jgi:hypothetical protein
VKTMHIVGGIVALVVVALVVWWAVSASTASAQATVGSIAGSMPTGGSGAPIAAYTRASFGGGGG